MGLGRTALSALLVTSLAACGGGGGGGSSGGNTSSGGSFGGGSSGGGGGDGCSLSERQDFARDVLNEWYLFPDLLDTGVNKSSFSSVQAYIDALVAPARAQNKDRFFTYITSIEEENAFFNSGTSAGFGIRLGYDTVNNRVFVLEAYENAPALGQNIDRGTELLAVGTSSSSLQSISSLMSSGGPQAVINALGPSDPGVTRVLQVRDSGGVTRELSLTKAEFNIDPVSDRYGAKVINDGGKLVGYLNLRTFIDTADNDLRTAIGDFKAQGISEIIVDFRYNGGGLVRTADLMGDLLGADNVGDVFSYTAFRASKSANDETELFQSEPNAIGATKIAFIGRGGTASASELVANSFIPYLNANTALVGTNTFGKPVGQIAIDKASCDDRMRVVAFKTENADRQGEYFDGLASVFPNSCAASDDISTQLGEPTEASIATALDFLAGRSCNAISATRTTAGGARQQLLQPDRPTAAQREVPGLF
ncbi:S41 family peptidase [Altererythrobacter sp. MF3-039]|uniref:S41 family peptidase n=1 Tax=Altererythrobacter sp. MF3-039 TaxID=3252901 RepID=UPI00390CC974